MISTDSTLFDGAEITKNYSDPTHKNLKYCRKELAAIFATVNCTIDEAKIENTISLPTPTYNGYPKQT